MHRPYFTHVPGDLPHGIMFHHFHGGEHLPRQGSLTATALEELLDYVSTVSDPLPAEDWLARARAGTLRPRDLCLTFDDCLRCQLDVAVPVLARRGLTAFFFVYSSVLQGGVEKMEVYAHFRHACYPSIAAFYGDFFAAVTTLPGGARHADTLARFEPKGYLPACPFYTDDDRRFRYLRDQVLGPEPYAALMDAMIGARLGSLDDLARTLWMREADVHALRAAGHVIGLHSFSHPTDLKALGLAEKRTEYERNARHLHELLGEPVTTVAHPCGSYDDATLTILRDLGVQVGFRADMALGTSASQLEMPRQDHANVMAMLAGTWQAPASPAAVEVG